MLELLQRMRKGHRQSDQHWNCFKGRERAIVSQTNTGTVSKDKKGPSSVRPTLELFQRTRKGHHQSDQHWNCSKGQERVIVSQTNTGTVLKATLKDLLRDRVDCMCTSFPSCIDTILSWSEVNYDTQIHGWWNPPVTPALIGHKDIWYGWWNLSVIPALTRHKTYDMANEIYL